MKVEELQKVEEVVNRIKELKRFRATAITGDQVSLQSHNHTSCENGVSRIIIYKIEIVLFMIDTEIARKQGELEELGVEVDEEIDTSTSVVDDISDRIEVNAEQYSWINHPIPTSSIRNLRFSGTDTAIIGD